MTDAGLRAIDAAKANGKWTELDAVEDLVLPEDLLEALAENEEAKKRFEAFAPSRKKTVLRWVYAAKREETRRERVTVSVELAEQGRTYADGMKDKYRSGGKQ